MITSDSSLVELTKALAAAKQRALYWSGNMSFTGHRFVPGKRGRKDHRLEYELAMDDVNNLSMQIEEATGRTLKRYDPKAMERARWAKLNEALATPAW